MDGKWWKRYRRDGFFVRGNGLYWYDAHGFHFRRYLTKRTLTVPFGRVTALETGTRHAGRWCFGMSILKMLWENDGRLLSSGFLLSRDRAVTDALASEFRSFARLKGER
jgi:hypothetical protein